MSAIIDGLVTALNGFFGSPALTTLIVSMFPLIELKGAIPIGTKLDMGLLTSAAMSYVGSCLVVIPVFFLLVPIFNLLKKIKFIKKIVDKIEGVFKRKASDLAEKSDGKADAEKIKLLGLLIFVAVPFPVTGVWTGTAIAVFLGLRFFDSFKMIVIGNFIAGLIITLLTFFFEAYVDYIILGMLCLAVIMLCVFIIKVIKSKPDSGKERTKTDANSEKV